jgi:hypothetical protein
MRRASLALLLVVLVAAVSWFAREAQNRRVVLPDRADWVTTDPDSQYHMRRLERALDEGGEVEQVDPRLNAPEGAAIPWPPYYTNVLHALLAPFVPSEGRSAWIERSVGSAACVASVLTSLLALFVAWRLAGATAGVAAGLLHALNGAAIEYGKLGNGDHHAFVSLLSGLVLALASAGFSRKALGSRKLGLTYGTLAGAVAGLSLGTWVASLLLVVQVQLALLVLLLVNKRRSLPGLGAFAFAFHAAALVLVLPALLSSPWTARFPWIVVNLSWFHLGYLAAGALLFVPLALRPDSAGLRRWMPAFTVGVAVVVALWTAFSDAAPARGVREGFEWVARVDSFMARIGESQPLVRDGELAPLLRTLGFAGFLLPLGWIVLLGAVRKGEFELLPWVVALPLLAVQAFGQARFAEGLALPLAVGLGVALARAMSARLPQKVPFAARMALAGVVALALVWPALVRSVERWPLRNDALRSERPATIGVRLAAEWIGAQPAHAANETVLALWSHGHVIERVAQRGSLATNFGSYVGESGFRASPRLLLEEDEATLAAEMERLHVRFAIVDSDLPNALNTLLDGVEPERRARYVASGSGKGGEVQPAWFRTFGARALFDGEVFGPETAGTRAWGRLRLVWNSPLLDPGRALRGPRDLAPAASVWELVAGAEVLARGNAGERFEVELDIVLPNGRRLRWRDNARIGDDGVALLRVPYATDAPNGTARVERAVGRVGSTRVGMLTLPQSAVLGGTRVEFAR